ncbi:fibroleukin-like [Lineus longissimus]|uniref:fibroleukin-like n=1 Tax=Lineus longissimus TaxID=88925 RepID=UPI002B4C7011
MPIFVNIKTLFPFFLLLRGSLEHRIVDTFGSKYFQLPGCLVDKARPATSSHKYRVDSDLECARKCLWLFEDTCRWMNYIEPEKVTGENCELGKTPANAVCSDLVDRPGYHYYEKGDFCLNQSKFVQSTLQCTCVPGWTGQRCNYRAFDCSDHYYVHLWPYGRAILDIKARYSTNSYKVHCDLSSYIIGGASGHTCFQRQGYSSGMNFDRNWADYKSGFGNKATDFWLGNDIISELTAKNSRKYRLLVWLQGHNSSYSVSTSYDDFLVKDESENYKVTLTPSTKNKVTWHGDAIMPGDPTLDMNKKPFSTYDKDNDGGPENCASTRKAGWWYGSGCTDANLNAKYYNATNWQASFWPQLSWGMMTNASDGIKYSTLCLQPYDFTPKNLLLVVY